jgi:hypothetical protein
MLIHKKSTNQALVGEQLHSCTFHIILERKKHYAGGFVNGRVEIVPPHIALVLLTRLLFSSMFVFLSHVLSQPPGNVLSLLFLAVAFGRERVRLLKGVILCSFNP